MRSPRHREIADGNVRYRSRPPTANRSSAAAGCTRRCVVKTPQGARKMTLHWIMCLADGRHTLLDIADRSGTAFETVRAVADILVARDAIMETEGDDSCGCS